MSNYPHAVLYTMDLEPITILPMSRWRWECLAANKHMVIPVPECVSIEHLGPLAECPAESVRMRHVRIIAERFRYRDAESLMLFTPDEEHALALKAAFLPGQAGAVKRVHDAGFGEGFLAAMLS